MKNSIYKKFQRIISSVLSFIFMISMIMPAQYVQAQGVANLPVPGTMLNLSSSYSPTILDGITIYPDNPLKFDFIIDVGDEALVGEALRRETQKLINYFMATLTVPEDEMWVNLSPYEKDRIIADGLGNTVMGCDMLAQDYILKQLAASLMYPEGEVGSVIWQRINTKVQEVFGTSEIPTNTFNKIWIVPETAVIYTHGTSVFVADSRLKVMLEEDYLALSHHDQGLDPYAADQDLKAETKAIIKEVLLPEIEREVNQGKHFAPLRQMYHSMVLATWYKNNLRESLLGSVYVDQNKIEGVDVDDKQIKNKIYNQYIEAFKQGVYDYVKEEYDAASQEIIPRKYFSGGLGMNVLTDASMLTNALGPNSRLNLRKNKPKVIARVDGEMNLVSETNDEAMLSKSGMAFIFGTGNNGTAIDENGQIYTANNSLIELGHNILYKAKLGKWIFTGKQMRGDKPSLENGIKENGDVSFEELFSGPNLARKFVLYDGAINVAEEHILLSKLPDGIDQVEDLFMLLQKKELQENEKKQAAQSIDTLLISLSNAVIANNEVAIKFVRENGQEIGKALGAMIAEYSNEKWVENFIMVSGVGENFAKIEGLSGEEDIFVHAIRQGLRSALKVLNLPDSRIEIISEGLVRSEISWEREIVAARVTDGDIQGLRDLGEDLENVESIGISLGGTKIGAGLISREGTIIKSSPEIKWRLSSQYNNGTSEGIVAGIVDQIESLLDGKGSSISFLKKIGVAFAGPVDQKKGVVGTPFPAPNLPFDKYDLKTALFLELKSRYGDDVLSKNLIIDVYNDGAAAVLGEVSPQGKLLQTIDVLKNIQGESSGRLDSEKVAFDQLAVPVNAYQDFYESFGAIDSAKDLFPITRESVNSFSAKFLTPNAELLPIEKRRLNETWGIENDPYGITEVYFLPESETQRKMVAFQEELKQVFGDKIFAVDPEKLHFTTQGLEQQWDNKDEETKKILATHTGLETINENEGVVLDLRAKASSIKSPAVKMQVARLNYNPVTGIFWELRPYLEEGQEDPIMQRRKYWELPEPRPPHVTAFYFTQEFSDSELTKLRTILKKYQDPTYFGDIDVDEVQVIAYEDFSFNAGYQVLETVRLEKDEAMLNNSYGGIDFNAGNLELKSRGQAFDFEFNNMPNIQPDMINGITPVIINITPLVDFPALLGQTDSYTNQNNS